MIPTYEVCQCEYVPTYPRDEYGYCSYGPYMPVGDIGPGRILHFEEVDTYIGDIWAD